MPAEEDMRRLRCAFGAVLFDLDDAIYAVPPTHGRPATESAKRVARLAARGSTRASARRRPLIETLQEVDAAVVGNEILGAFVSRYARRVIEIPTTVEPVTGPSHSPAAPPVVTWMGLPDNMAHLDLVRRPLVRLRSEIEFTLRIVSSTRWERSPVDAEFVGWSEAASRDALLSSTVGIAPLSDDPWTRGKCALRSIQYGGHGLATVASPVGITHRVVRHRETGYLATSEDDWARSLGALLRDAELASAMGEAALAHIAERYSNEVAVSRWSALIGSL
jgi:hypothetical protein